MLFSSVNLKVVLEPGGPELSSTFRPSSARHQPVQPWFFSLLWNIRAAVMKDPRKRFSNSFHSDASAAPMSETGETSHKL